MKRETQKALATMATAAARATGAQKASVTACPSLFEREYMYDESPLAVIEFSLFPSVNDAIAVSRSPRGSSAFKHKWQLAGRDAVKQLAVERGLKTEEFTHEKIDNKTKRVIGIERRTRLVRVLFAEPVEVVLRIWRPSLTSYDCHNPYVKPVFDGFTQARLWHDDSVKYVCEVRMRHEGVDRSLVMPDDEKYMRQRKQEVRRARHKSAMRFPMFGRFKFEFYARP